MCLQHPVYGLVCLGNPSRIVQRLHDHVDADKEGLDPGREEVLQVGFLQCWDCCNIKTYRGVAMVTVSVQSE